MSGDDFKPGDRVVSISHITNTGRFGVVVEADANEECVAVLFDGDDAPYRAAWPGSMRKLPPAWQPKDTIFYSLACASGESFTLSRDRYGKREEATDAARRSAPDFRGYAIIVVAVVPIVEVIAPTLVAPPVEVREL